MAHDILNPVAHMILSCCQPYSTATIKELPVFKPNDYFFMHHQKEGEEQWMTYMRVVREIMGDQLHFKLSEGRLEDKFDYKGILYPSKGLKNKFD